MNNSTIQNNSALPYISSLDGVRAIAVMLVVSTHWPNNMLSLKFGWIGVNIFFVLSGYLITRILVQQKTSTLKNYLTRFYYNRALRIFPIYYLFLLVGFVLILLLSAGFPQLFALEAWRGAYYAVTHDWPYYLTYTYNLKINLRYFTDSPDSSNQFFGHIWSLCFEEQFYLVFPLIVYFASKKNLKRIIILIIILCPILRLYSAIYLTKVVTDLYWLGELFYSNTLLQADALAWGAAIAVFKFEIKNPHRLFYITSAVWLAVGMLCFYFLRKSGYFLVEGKSLGYNFPGFWFEQQTSYFLLNIRPFYQFPLVNLLAVTFILPATLNKPLFPSFLDHPWMSYIGKISYGIYLFHNPIIASFILVASFWGGWNQITEHPLSELIIFVLYCGVVFIISHLSYRHFEKRILTYKSKSHLTG